MINYQNVIFACNLLTREYIIFSTAHFVYIKKALSPLSDRAFFQFQLGILFLKEHYDIEHTLSLEEAIEDLSRVCRGNGGGY